MNTERNRSKVLALALRAAVDVLTRSTEPKRPLYVHRADRLNALASVETIAAELEQLAAAPDHGVAT